MNKMNWKKLVAALSCCAVVWGAPSHVTWAADSVAQNEEGLLDGLVDFYHRFCGTITKKVQVLATPLLEPYAVHYASGASRGNDHEKVTLLPQPMPGSTLLANHNTRFAWSENRKAKTFTIKEADSGKIIYNKNLDHQSELFLVPKEAKMQQGRAYLWELDGDGDSIRREVRLLDAALDANIQKQLQELETIELANKDINRQALKAAYLVTWSDESKGMADMHWLALEMLTGADMDKLEDDTNKTLRRSFIRACREHLDQQLP